MHPGHFQMNARLPETGQQHRPHHTGQQEEVTLAIQPQRLIVMRLEFFVLTAVEMAVQQEEHQQQQAATEPAPATACAGRSSRTSHP
jgi:hypothetical protein